MLTQSEREAVRLVLGKDEFVVSSYAPDLNHQSEYVSHRVVLTNRRILWRSEQGSWNDLQFTPDQELVCTELAGIQTVELRCSGEVLASWRSTLSQVTAANDFREAFAELRRRPKLHHGKYFQTATSRGVVARHRLREFFHSPLFRLMKFARARFKAVLVGFILTLSATAVSLIPPYLTMPLVDEVLVPAQIHTGSGAAVTHAQSSIGRWAESIAGEGQSMAKVAVYLGGLGLAALLAWLLACLLARSPQG